MNRYQVICGTTSILHSDLNRLAQSLQSSIAHAGYLHDPVITSHPLTRRLVLSASIESAHATLAIAIAKAVLLSHLYDHAPEYRRIGIHHAEATREPTPGHCP